MRVLDFVQNLCNPLTNITLRTIFTVHVALIIITNLILKVENLQIFYQGTNL